MKRWWNIAFQTVASVTQLANIYAPFLPPKLQGTVTGILTVAQGAVAILAHQFNPDGTPAAQPYRK